MRTMKIFRYANIGFSVIALCTLFIENFVTNDLNIESGVFELLALLILLNAVRMSFWYQSPKVLIGILINLGLFGFLLFHLFVFTILALGQEFSLIMNIALLLNLAFIPLLIHETRRLIKLRRNEEY